MPNTRKTVTTTDKGYKALLKRVYGFERPSITVGVHATEGAELKNEPTVASKDEGSIVIAGIRVVPKKSGVAPVKATTPNTRGITVADVATWMEFGTDTVPARSFIRAWFDENQDRARKMLVAMMWSFIDGKLTKEQILETLGQNFVGEIQKRISQGIPPPLQPATIKRKGSSVPLIDTGQLRSSITHQVHAK